jgi:hypothetical protein
VGALTPNGAVTIEGGTTVQNNRALGGTGGSGYGGGVDVASGSARLGSVTLSSNTAEAWMRRRVEWREDNNRYQVNPLRFIMIRSEGVDHATSHTSLAKWNTFWGLRATGSSEGVIRFQGGNLNARASAQDWKLTLDDFRLRPDSPGYHADKDGKDLGADIDLVGPGKAYERWKKTSEYKEWPKESK